MRNYNRWIHCCLNMQHSVMSNDWWLVCFDTCLGLHGENASTDGMLLSEPITNPLQGPLSFTCYLTENSDILMSVFDVTGRLVHRETEVDHQLGLQEYSWIPSSSLPNGSYMLLLETCWQRAAEKFVLLR